MQLKLERISGESTELVITLWHVSENEEISKGQDILEVSTDKATFDVPSPCDGRISNIFKKAGETVRAEEPIADIMESGEQRPEIVNGNPETDI